MKLPRRQGGREMKSTSQGVGLCKRQDFSPSLRPEWGSEGGVWVCLNLGWGREEDRGRMDLDLRGFPPNNYMFLFFFFFRSNRIV